MTRAKNILGLAAAGLISLCTPPPARGAETGGPLIIHEWGTFTNFAGSDGLQRKFATEIGLGATLPKFVMTYPEGGATAEQRPITFSKSELVCSQRMETPVIYIYPGCRGPVDIEARLLDGAMTEFYPPVNAPAAGADRSIVRWEHITYDANPTPPTPPADPDNKDSHYFRARDTDSCLLTVTAAGKAHHEKFLFYRGAANFNARITVKALGNDKLEVHNTTGQTIPAAFAVEVRDHTTRWARFEHLADKALVALPNPTLPTHLPNSGGSADDLQKSLEGELVKAGLFDKEAKAMVNTWRDQWFQEPGTRILYIIPSAEVNRILPLKINPTPDTLVRVFVGRSDVLTPENESALLQALARLKPADTYLGALDGAPTFGRFQAAALQRARELRDAAGRLAENGTRK